MVVSEPDCEGERLGEVVGEALSDWDAVPVKLGVAELDRVPVTDAVPLVLGVPEPLGDLVAEPDPVDVPEALGVPLALLVWVGVGEQTDLTAVSAAPGKSPRFDHAEPAPGEVTEAVAKPSGPTGGIAELFTGTNA